MSAEFDDNSLRSKRRKVNADPPDEATPSVNDSTKGLDRPITPPFSKRGKPIVATQSTPSWSFNNVPKQTASESAIPDVKLQSAPAENERDGTHFISSPIQLTHIQDMAPHQNIDSVSLKDILGDPMIKECWNFNFLFDLDFVMKHFDSDVRDTVKIKIVHGFWKKEDERRINLLETAERYPNVELLSAYIPDPFGTHHSKMLVLIRHDDLAQVIIHTANMISRDWGNMTQAVWSSPLLPLLPEPTQPSLADDDSKAAFRPIGSGERFKVDLLKYIGAYERRLRNLNRQLANYDFSAVKAAFIGSAPSRQKTLSSRPERSTSFGWVGLQEILSSIPLSNQAAPETPSHIVMQISSIATSTPAWHTHFQSILARHSPTRPPSSPAPSASSSKASTFFLHRKPSSKSKPTPPKFNIVFPTPAEIRTSLDGYNSGHSIHMKLASAAQQKQLAYLQPLFCHWNQNQNQAQPASSQDNIRREALRGPAAPHIKTYIRFTDTTHCTIDWALLTSANLSTQAWGNMPSKNNEVWIQSWETGVVVWPALFAGPADTRDAVMVPLFGKQEPAEEDVVLDREEGKERDVEGEKQRTVVGLRMPYDVPLSSYADDEMPWCASSAYREPDWKGRSWGGYQSH